MEAGKLKAALRTELDDVARRKALQGYEIPREFIVELHPFSKENHLLTDSNKPARGQLKKRCAPSLPRAMCAGVAVSYWSWVAKKRRSNAVADDQYG